MIGRLVRQSIIMKTRGLARIVSDVRTILQIADKQIQAADTARE